MNEKTARLIKNKQLPTIALFIPSIETGGAERQFLELVKGIDKTKWRILILTMYNEKGLLEFTDHIEGIVPICLKKRNPITFLYNLSKILRKERVKILHAYLLTAQAYAILAKLLLWRGKLVFGVRDSLKLFQIKTIKDMVSNLLVFGCSFFVDQYIFNSYVGMRAKKGYISANKIRILFNGIDTEKFKPDVDSYILLRQYLNIPANAHIVGIVANVSCYKDYPTFIKAAKIVADQIDSVHFVAIGDNSSAIGNVAKNMVTELSIGDRFHFLGLRMDVEKLMPGMDVICSSSVTEGFSNSICEAMACGVPCVVTDVGDSSFIVGDTGIVVPPAEPEKLANGILQILSLSDEKRSEIRHETRQKIVNDFAIRKMVDEHDAIYESLLYNR